MAHSMNPNQIISDEDFNDFLNSLEEHVCLAKSSSPDMVKVYLQDGIELMMILEDCIQGRREEAQKRIQSLDSLVKGVIPDSVWEKIFDARQ